MNREIRPIKRIRGEVKMPGDKSISHRAIMLGAISEGRTEALNFLESEDCISTVNAFKKMGVSIVVKKGMAVVEGRGLNGLKKPQGDLYLGNSGTSMRLIAGILAGQDFGARLTGDRSLSSRPMARIAIPLKLMGAQVKTTGKSQTPPIVIKGGNLKPVDYKLPIASAQVKSCVLLAGLYAKGVTSLREPTRSRDHTERMLKYFGADLNVRGLKVSVKGKPRLKGKRFIVPGDISSAAFFIAAATLVEKSELIIRDVGLNPTRMGFVKALLRMGADIKIMKKRNAFEPSGDILVGSSSLKGIRINEGEVPSLIDEIPLLAVLASLAKGATIIKGVSELKVKETDRVSSIVYNLSKLGADIKAKGDGLIIRGNPGRFNGGKRLASFKDHRTAMSMAIASLLSLRPNTIEDADCVSISFPSFFDLLDRVAVC